MNGEFVAWEDAKVHVLTHALHYGTGVFEGIRALRAPSAAPAIFRHDDHLDRLERSAKLYYMDLPFSREQLREATHELIARNGFRACYIRPLVYRGHGPMGLNPLDNPVEAMIAVLGVGRLPRRGGQANGVRAHACRRWRRISPDSLIPHVEGVGPVPELGAGEDRGAEVGLRGGDPARRPRPRLRGHRRERLHRAATA